MFFRKSEEGNTFTNLLGFAHNKGVFMLMILGVTIKFIWME